jgi:O-acetylserine/cysteine efflux transporter
MNTEHKLNGFSCISLFLVLLVTAVWGFNFIVIKVGVAGVPPLFLAALRFIFSFFPAFLFVRRPKVSWFLLAAYGLCLGVGEFGFLFTAIKLGAPAGLSSIILQSQAFFTVLLASTVLKEKIRFRSISGMLISGAGVLLIAVSEHRTGTAGFTSGLLSMVLVAAFFWAAANIIAQKMPETDGLSLVVWSSLFSPVPLLILSLVFEGPASIILSLKGLQPVSAGALAYLVLLSTLFGYGVWNQIIIRYGAGRVAPFSLLVPVFGIASSTFVLHERISVWDALASVLVLLGLVVHLSGKRSAGKV